MKNREFQPRFEPPKGALKVTNISHPGMVFWENPKNGFTIAVCHYTADPKKRSQEWFDEETRLLREDQKIREYEIDFTSRAGAKAFPYLKRFENIYRIDDIDLNKIPSHWRIFAGLDYGATNPTSIHLYAITGNSSIVSLFEFYQPSHYRQIARVLKGKEQGFEHPLFKRIEAVIADPSIWKNDQNEPMKEDMTSIADLIKDQGIYNLEKAQNARLAGLERIRDVLDDQKAQKGETPKPTLRFCRRCRYQWQEFCGLVLEEIPPERMEGRNLCEDIVKKHDHSYDECRYVSMRVKNGLPPKYDSRENEFVLEKMEKEMDAIYDEDESFY